MVTEVKENENYYYRSETHWSYEGICRLVKRDDRYSLSYGSGGWNKGFSDEEIALAVSEAFRLAAKRLRKTN